MDTKRQTQLIQTMEEYDLKGTSFHDAKQELLENGYLANEIDIAVASAAFDGKRNVPKPPDELQSAFENDPEATNRVGLELLQMDAERQQQKTRVDAVMGGFQSPLGGSVNPVNVQGQVNLSSDLGIPIYKIVGIGIFITAVLYGLAVNRIIDSSIVSIFIRYYSIAIAVLFFIMFVIDEVKLLRLKSKVEPAKSMFAKILPVLVIAALVCAYLFI